MKENMYCQTPFQILINMLVNQKPNKQKQEEIKLNKNLKQNKQKKQLFRQKNLARNPKHNHDSFNSF